MCWVVSAISHKILSFKFVFAVRSIIVMTDDATDLIIFIFNC